MSDSAHSPTYRAALTVVQTLRKAGYEAYFAGGCVRDLLLGGDPKDFDVATSAMPDQVISLFPHTQAVGAHFGVILVLGDVVLGDVVLGDAPGETPEQAEPGERIAIEVATFRHDGVYSDGRRPDSVRYSTDAHEDVQRRDFTINGMLLDPVAYAQTGNQTGKQTGHLKSAVIDHVGGRKDLAARTIRAIGDPGRRFDEDKLRMLRAVRFAARLDFAIDPATLAAIRAHAHMVKKVSSERIREELTRMLTQGNARRAFELLEETGLLQQVLPEAVRLKGVAQPPQFHPEGDVWVHTLLLLEKLPAGASPTLAWGALLHDIGKPATYQPPDPTVPGDRIRFNGHVEVGMRMSEVILERLRFSREQSDQIVALVKNHMRFGDLLNMREATLKRFLRLPRFEEHLELHRMDCLSSHGDLRLYEYAKEHFETATPEKIRPRLLVTGRDLIAAGYRPGTQFKEMLEAAEDAQLENRVSSRTEAMKLLREHFGAPPQAFSTLTSA